jgi:uncharacterized cupin superfamily protein
MTKHNVTNHFFSSFSCNAGERYAHILKNAGLPICAMLSPKSHTPHEIANPAVHPPTT